MEGIRVKMHLVSLYKEVLKWAFLHVGALFLPNLAASSAHYW